MAADRLRQESLSGLLVPLLGEQKVNGLAGLVYRAIEIAPLPLHFDVRLVHAPTDPHRALAAMKRLFQQGTVFDHPALDGRVVDRDPTLLQQFFDMSIA